jgi:hypothetical protein
MTPFRAGHIRIRMLCAALLAVWSCCALVGCVRDPEWTFDELSGDLRFLTTSHPEARLAAWRPAAVEGHSARAAWTVRLFVPWSAYSAWLAERLLPEWHARTPCESTEALTFLKMTRGDSLSLEVRLVSSDAEGGTLEFVLVGVPS